MQVDFSQNYFKLFGLPVQFAMDEVELHERWKVLQKTVHPDKFVSGTDAERRYSMQVASLINEAHKVLRTPLDRAGYLLKLNGIDLDVETDTRMAPDFLMGQMELREEIDEVRSSDDPYIRIDRIRKGLVSKSAHTAVTFEEKFSQQEFEGARESVRQWQFLTKLIREISAIEAELDDA